MHDTSIFDVLVVYTDSIATSASSKKAQNAKPFSLAKNREHYSVAYAYFLSKCHKIGLTAAFTTSGDIVGPGTCKSYWIYKNRKWYKKNQMGFSTLVFDKFSPLRKSLRDKREMLFSEDISKPFNDPDLMSLFNDKLKTFKRLEGYTIPTVNITKKTIESSITKLEDMVLTHKNSGDFTKSLILKDRFGAGGIDIYKIGGNAKENIAKVLKSLPKISFVLQPFAKFDKGYVHKNLAGYTDIRIIFSQGKIVQRYIRTAKEKDFRCNEHQGGKVIYVNASEIPQSIKKASSKILKILDKEDALFALDFLVSNDGNAYFLEGNINPGIYWGLNSRDDKVHTKKLIRKIVGEIFLRTNSKRRILNNYNLKFPNFFDTQKTISVV